MQGPFEVFETERVRPSGLFESSGKDIISCLKEYYLDFKLFPYCRDRIGEIGQEFSFPDEVSGSAERQEKIEAYYRKEWLRKNYIIVINIRDFETISRLCRH